MAEEVARSRQYAYQQNSNLVLQADSESRRRPDEPTGEVESLAGRISYRMGDRAQKATPQSSRKRRDGKDDTDAADTNAKRHKKTTQKRREDDAALRFTAATRSDILRESSAFEAAAYRPKSAASQDAYETILGVVAQQLGAQPGEILAGAAEEVLGILKSDAYRDDEKLKETQKLLKTLPAHTFSHLVAAGKRVTDFYVESGDNKAEDDGEDQKTADGDEDVDKEMGVAVVFDEEDEEEESDLDEVRDEEEEEEEEEEGGEGRATAGREAMKMKDGYEDEDDVDARYRLDVHAIDAFWLQRELSKFYKDAESSAKLAEEVLAILKEAGSDLSACENRLVLLLDYDKFDFIKLLLENRAKVLYCTRLKQAQNDDERRSIEEEMVADETLEDGEGKTILDQLRSTASADSWMQDRIGAMETTSRAEANKLRKLQQKSGGQRAQARGDESDDDVDMEDVNMKDIKAEGEGAAKKKPQHYVDVESLAFQEGGHLMSNRECRLPEGTWRAQKKGYEEVHVPAVRTKMAVAEEKARIKISTLPKWAQGAFKNMESLNRVQSKMYPAAFETSENLLLCAPTGAGKTNVAMLTILHEVMKARDPETGEIDLNSFKIVYVAPMKALVQEVVLNLSARLSSAYGIQVRELSGDQNLSREQLFNTQIIVTTPEKWDIITRKSGDDRTYTQLVRLVIIDEIHLLHDTRGPVLEALVARTIRNVEATQQMVRLVGLSATLPNYEDVAAFLRVDPAQGLFYFDSSYRPVPLQQQYIGIMEKKAVKRFALMNEICYEKVMEQAELDNQVLIFVHSRKETASTAQALRDLFVENDTLARLIRPNSASSEVLLQEAEKIERNDDLKDLLPYGFGIHHAGMKRQDRTLVENAFADGHLKVLVSTSTLAWGVNLPAHTVIIKGTQIYNAEKGDWCELSPLDILQMLGRAGRVQFDTQGEGIIITQHSQLTYYLSLMNQQLPVESQMMGKLADNLNAEIVVDSVQNVAQAATWLGYTYLFIRMLRNPTLYGISIADRKADPTLLQYRTDLVHSAATLLAKHNLIKYERRSGLFQVTALGRVASHYYIAHDSISTYNEYLKPHMSDIEILRLFSLSNEFKYVIVRSEEKLELVKLLERVPVPVKESLVSTALGSVAAGSGSAKVNVLLQAYISRLRLDGFALLADMAHIHQSAARIFRALFEICLTRGWASLAERMLSFCKMVDKRMWLSHSPLRQFAPGISETILKRIEKKDISWDKYNDLEPADLGQLINNPQYGKQLYKMIHQFPKLELSAHVQPITRSMLKVDLVVTPDFEFTREVHGNAEGFWVFVEDVDGETILHHEWLLIKRRFASQETYLSFTMPLFEPLAPLYYVKVISDKWIHCESSLPISFHKLILPQKNAPPTELLDLQPLFVNNILLKLVGGKKKTAESVLKSLSNARQVPNPWRFKRFNPIQTQVLPRLLESDSNLFIGSPPGSGKGVLAELAIMKTLLSLGQPDLKSDEFGEHLLVYLTPKESSCHEKYEDWNAKFGEESFWRQNVVELTGDSTADLRLLASANILIATPTQWDVLSRRWKQRKRIQNVSLLLLDETHFVGGGEYGPTIEIVMSRMRFIAADMDKKKKAAGERGGRMRILAMSNSIANARDVGEWLGASASEGIFNFHPNVRPQPLEIRVQGFEINDFSSRMLAMAKPLYNTVANQAEKKPVVVFVPSAKQAQLSAIDLITFALAENDPQKFVSHSAKDKVDLPLEDAALLHTLENGVGYCTDTMASRNREYVLHRFATGKIQVLIVPQSMAWELRSAQINAFMVVIMGTQFYDGREHRYVDYQLADVFQMTKFANHAASPAVKCVLFCHASKIKFYAKFLYDPLPVESQLEHFLSDHINAEIVTKTIESKQDAVDYLTWTFMYRRFMKNPNYYNLQGATNVHLSDHLSELVETTVNALEESRCIQVVEEEEDEENEGEERLVPLNLGMIAAYYYIKYTTIELFACSLKADSKVRALLTILSSATEFSDLPSRFGEDKKLEGLAKHLKFSVAAGGDYGQAHVKTNVLLQVHFSKQHDRLSPALRQDLDFILRHAVRLLHAMVDVISSNGWLKPALAAMDLAQMVVQAQWSSDSPLLQIPFFTRDMLKKLGEMDLDEEVETPVDILSMEDDARGNLLPLDTQKMSAVAKFCNAYPDVTVQTKVQQDGKNLPQGSAVSVKVQLEREGADEEDEEEEQDESKELGLVNACHYPAKKAENWWVVLGDSKKNTLLSIKRVPFASARANVALQFAAPDEIGSHTFQLYVICDGYAGCDLENEVKITVVQGEDTEEEEEEDEEE
ncbi:U5 small nuclear ribonucleoprotein helicase [Phytophthora fragariae]|uniref:U5 small nuclear ribonucleoprotein helicase n=1 Tax=Phytophthora fragariae TaxID=53985 RepID=A0A6G0R549_9STRA|nr:U5 small nuclear ribonucleoprotein helicase [Phytophthora fragariae]